MVFRFARGCGYLRAGCGYLRADCGYICSNFFPEIWNEGLKKHYEVNGAQNLSKEPLAASSGPVPTISDQKSMGLVI